MSRSLMLVKWFDEGCKSDTSVVAVVVMVRAVGVVEGGDFMSLVKETMPGRCCSLVYVIPSTIIGQ